MVGHKACLGEVGGTLQPHGKRVEARPVCLGAALVLDAHLAVSAGYGRDYRRVETAREQHPVGHVGHELSPDGIGQPGAYVGCARPVVLHGLIVHPVALVVSAHTRLAAPVVVSRQERLIALALSLESLQLRSHQHLAVAVVAYIERYHADGVAGYEKLVTRLVVEHEGEYAVELLQHTAYLPVAQVVGYAAVESQHHLAVAARLELVAPCKAAAKVLMVVYLAIHGQHLLAVGRKEWLAARLRVDDAQPLVGQYGTATHVYAAPVGAAVAYFLTHQQGLLAQLRRWFAYSKYCCYSTHKFLRFDGSQWLWPVTL